MNFKLIEIKSKTFKNYSGKVYDLTVQDDHSYNVENIIVHNSICKTRVQTGVGVPTLSTVLDCYKWKCDDSKSVALIADGGIRYPGDFAKSIAAGADAIIVGRILAGSNQAPGKIIDGHKVYRGMASYELQADKRGGLKRGTCAEGVSTMIKCCGDVNDILQEYRGGLTSSMTYLNARTLDQYRKNSRFMMISDASLSESHAFGTRK